jgi:hypothetical protein
MNIHIHTRSKEPGELSRYSDWLRAGRPKGRSSESRWGKEFSLLYVVSGTNQASYPMGTEGSFFGGKAAGA